MTKTIRQRLLAAAALSLALAGAPALADPLEAIDPVLAMGAGDAALETLLEQRCEGLERIDVATPRFPLAAERETHFVCDGLDMASGARLDRAVFTLGDGALVQLNATGGAGALTQQGEAQQFRDFTVWPDAGVLIDSASDTVWVLNPDGLHTNLFMWRHPALDGAALPAAQALSFTMPAEIRLGETLEVLAPEIEAACAFTRTFDDEPGLPTGNTTQTQIDCFGYDVAGFDRKIEFVFADGRLALAWILTGVGDEARLRDMLTAQYGEPAAAVPPGLEFFPGDQIALRTDKPEILVASDAVVSAFLGR
ncbi:hypothetical protein [Maricaulis salignorans]|uniref:Uncharacterized protein n=1 Tax=Maricaulis salignorans TaxID=144026 RepID=A0A1G9UUA0_9PROT|nr:hypothetical protein [Maricaulis salignorans]SDM63534.1 hypothetical protein SAMN04488568_11670 [Maricaulis salignorans]